MIIYENNELLYTQKDMDKWMRTCENLQGHLNEQEEQIKYLEDLCDKERLKAISLQQQIREEKAVFDMYRANTIQKEIADPEATKIIRKQVCDEIRELLRKQKIQADDGVHAFLQNMCYWQDIDAILDKAEREEE